jgi:hypothetical protein
VTRSRAITGFASAGRDRWPAALGWGSERASDAIRTARYLRGRREFRARRDDVFISSYPRSGTTWLQMIAHVLLRDGDTGFTHISEVVPWFERLLSLGRARATDFELRASPRVFKSHLPYRWLPAGARYIYAVRDGRDVAVSYYHFYRSHLGYEGDFADFFTRFARGRLQYKSWFKHVAGWQRVAARDPRVLLVEYEVLAAEPVATIARIGEFLGCGHPPARVAELAELCSFAAMKRFEAKFDHATAEPGGAGSKRGAFIRRGEPGSHRDQLTSAQQATFERLRGRSRLRPDLELDIAAFLH